MHFNSLRGWLEWQERLHPRKIDLGLDRVLHVYHTLNPDNARPLTVTVGGTNGKGSCIAMLEAIYLAQGYRVGAYTSPHILKYNERIKIGGIPVSDHLICESFERIEAARENISLSYFEFGTLAALDIFSRANLDVQLLEVGLGGRLDAVNIIDADATIVTSIAIDHSDWLGATRDAIGREKAGIFRTGIPAVIGEPDPPHSLLQRAEQVQAHVFRYNQDYWFKLHENSWDWQSREQQINDLPKPALQGRQQLLNASAVLQTLCNLQGQLPLERSAIETGLRSVSLNGRYQLIKNGNRVLLDVGHNPQAVTALSDYLRQKYSGVRVHAVFSMMQDKDIHSVVSIMKPLIADWFITPALNIRSADERQITAAFEANNIENYTLGFSSFRETYNAARSMADDEDLILVFGSFFIVSEFLAGFKQV